MFFNQFDSTAIDEIEVNDNIVTVVYKSSGIRYTFDIVDEEFTNNLQNTIVNEESIGKFINNAIKNKQIVEFVVIPEQERLNNPDTSDTPAEEVELESPAQ